MGQLHYLSSYAEIGVSDLEASVRWYGEELGFMHIATYGDAVHMRRAEGQDVLLRPAGAALTLHLATEVSLGELAGERVAGEPETVEVRDPDGHVLRFFARERPLPRV